jgi:hypothetical protein
MNDTLFSRAETFIWTSARLIERQVYACLFCNGPAEGVIRALAAYQNPDGGFGNALEPDNRCPDSQPIFIEHALYILDMVNAITDPRVRTDMLLPVCDYLQTITTSEGGVPFVLPTANRYPHTPWMGAPENPPAALNPTASIAGLLFKSGVQHAWLDRASDFCWREIPANQKEGFHDLMPVTTFLLNAPDQKRAAGQLERISEIIRKPGVVEMDPTAGGYVKMPLDWAPTPTSFFRKLFDDETLRLHLTALARRQQADGGWAINWDPISPVVDYEWRGRLTIDALVSLRGYKEAGFSMGD